MRSKWKRLFSLLLVFALVLTMIPCVYAEDTMATTEATEETEAATQTAPTQEPPQTDPAPEETEAGPPVNTDSTEPQAPATEEAAPPTAAIDQPSAEDGGADYGVMAAASTTGSVFLFDQASPNYTTVLNSQVTIKYKPNGTGSSVTAYIKNMGWHYAKIGGVAYPDDPIYCIQPHLNYGASTSGNYVDNDMTLNGGGSSHGADVWYSMPESYRRAITMTLLFSRQMWNNSYSVTNTAKANNPNVPLRVATQFLLYEIVTGLRDPVSFDLNSSNGYTSGDVLYNAGVSSVTGFASCYDSLVASVKAAMVLPSFVGSSASNAPTIELRDVLTIVTDTNGVLPNFSFGSGNGASFTQYGNDLYIEQVGTISESTLFSCSRTAPSADASSVAIYYSPVTSYQACVKLFTPSTGTLRGYFRLRAPAAGNLAIKKTTEDGQNLNGWRFGIYSDAACTRLVYGPYTSNASGSITVSDLTPGTYYVKELGHNTASINAKYHCTSTNPQRVVVNNGETATAKFQNDLVPGYVKIQKTTNTGKNLGGWKFNIYTDAGRTKLVSGSPFVSGSDGALSVALKPGTYYIKEVNESASKPDWTFDDTVHTVTITAGNTASITFKNTQYGYAKIVKETNTGKDLGFWRFNIFTDEACTQKVSGSPFVSGSDGTITTKLLPGTYFVQEVTDPQKKDWDFDNATKKVTVTGGSTATVTFTNCHFGYAKIIKQTSSGEDLAGWKFNIYADETCTTLYPGSPFVSGEDGTITARIPAGTWFVQEVDESDCNPDWVYDTTVKKITVEGGKTASVTITNTLCGYAEIRKTTNTGTDLANWKFHIFTDRACTQMVTGSPFTTDSQGIIKTRLIPGTYYVREVDESKEKPDWVFDDAVREITVATGETATVSFLNEQMGRVKLIKAMPDGGSVAGWVFDIHSSDGQTHLGTFVTDKDGTILTGYLQPGDVQITERIPEDSPYVCDGENPKKVTIQAGKTSEVTFTNRLKSAEILIQKVEITGAPLAGAEFLLEWSKDGTSWAPVVRSVSGGLKEGTCTSPDIVDGKLVSGDSGLVQFTGLHPDLYYRVTETKAPDGFQLLAETAFEGKIPEENDLKVALTVVNVRTFQLPETGSKSLVMTAISLTLASGLCAALLVAAKRKEKRR